MFIAPFFIVFAVFGLYPIVYTFILSFQKWDGLAKMTPLGWKNYARLLTDDVFYLSIWNTIRIWIFNFVPQMLTALLLSALFTFNRIRGMKFFRAAYYLPNLITAASVGLLFNLLFDGNKSVANYILQALHRGSLIPVKTALHWKLGNDTTLVVSYKNNGIVAICGLKDDSGASIGE